MNSKCGAVKGACHGIKLGNLTTLLDNKEIALEGGMYDVDTGIVTFYDK
ncbi:MULTISPECIES: hypothetical protein [Nitrosomonas]|uniref:Carbonic anhydrase n=1 Tax=Nitrosomonas eutropha (strain DSM 101675 / C91 / Nm57) TaxID=335283 RepID=Q0AHW9_NITEC|nr:MULTISPECIES: hypothetical protein [Nitrosomonas]ABI59063.1 hypothetical protein Neut_0794 [Nitrosomonas eutropha C91]